MDLEEVWRIREEDRYPALFGPLSRGIFPLDQTVFGRFGNVDVDPRWLTYGVLEYAPHEGRESWVYVSSGFSNPWDRDPSDYDSAGPSGAGLEFMLETDGQFDWAIQVLQNMMAYDLLLAAGRFGDRPPIAMHDRIPINAPLDGRADTVLRVLMTVRPLCVTEEVALPSGTFGFMSFLGISESEAALARSEGADVLIDRLTRADAFPVTRVSRDAVT